ncbi:MAG: hypothetical protein IJ109_10600 [Firmicutes bacterium]|nr:hypothetical protein [Bacillota bacterium]
MKRYITAGVMTAVLTLAMVLALCGCGSSSGEGGNTGSGSRADIESALDLSNMNAEWTYDEDADAWTMAPVTAVTNPQIEDEQGVSVCVPGAYVKGIDTNGDGEADETSGTAAGNLIIDTEAEVTSTNGQKYTAQTAPVIVNTGAAGYSEQQNQTAAATYAKEGYINVACGNRGKQSQVTDADGNETYTGDAPSCLVDQKNAVRFVKYNILLGNLPGSVDYFVSTGGSGGGAHATMLAATSDNPDYYVYEAAAGAVGVYKDGDSYTTTVTIDGEEVELSDGMWGCMAYSAITSLQEADMALAFEYYLNTEYEFNTSFQKQLAEYLSREYMDYINGQDLTIDEAKVGFDLDGDGETSSAVKLTIEYDQDKYPETNGYGGTYLDLYLAEFEASLEDYLQRLDYTEDWTWFDADGTALTDEEVASMTAADKAQAFLEGRVAVGSTGSDNGAMQGGPGGDFAGGGPDGNSADGGPGGKPSKGEMKGGTPPDRNGKDAGTPPDMNASGSGEKAGTPDAGTTQSAGSGRDSASYDSYEDMLAAYQSDIASIEEGDEYGNNIVSLYDPLNYIGADGTSGPVWSRILMGASEGDISMMNSLNLQIAWLNAGTDAEIEWQWNGGHVPSEILGDSLPLYVDMMYGKYVDGAVTVKKAKAQKQTENGDAEEPTATDISGWVSYDEDSGEVSFALADAASYRTAGAAKAMPAFDVIDYGQEDYVFGNSETDARHWDKYVLQVLEEHADTLKKLFNAGS